MITKLIGWFLVAAGTLFVLKPVILKNRLHKKAYKKARKYLFAIGFVISSYLIGLGFRFHGFLPKLLMVIGIFGIIKIIFFLQGKTYEQLLEYI